MLHTQTAKHAYYTFVLGIQQSTQQSTVRSSCEMTCISAANFVYFSTILIKNQMTI